MNKFLFFFAVSFAVTIAVPLYSQDYFVGMSGGLNYAHMDIKTMRIDQKVDLSRLYGFGGILGVHFYKNMSLQLEPMYFQKGGIYKNKNENIDIRIRYSVLEVPLFLKTGFGEKIQPYLFSGPSLALVTNSQGKVLYESINLDIDLGNVTKDFEISLVCGGGVSISVGKGSLFLSGSYAIGLTNLNRGGTITYDFFGSTLFDLDIDKQDEFKNKGFKILIGYTFPFAT